MVDILNVLFVEKLSVKNVYEEINKIYQKFLEGKDAILSEAIICKNKAMQIKVLISELLITMKCRKKLKN